MAGGKGGGGGGGVGGGGAGGGAIGGGAGGPLVAVGASNQYTEKNIEFLGGKCEPGESLFLMSQFALLVPC